MIRFGLKLQHAKRTLGLCAALALGACGVTPDPAPGVSVQNLDGLPFPDRLVFSRIGSLSTPPGNGVHDTVKMRISNSGSSTLRITGFDVTGPWTVTPAPSATQPLEIAAGSSADVTVKFVAQAPGNVTPHLYEGLLKAMSGTSTVATVQLAGLWQSESENNQEPSFEDIRRAFGFNFSFVSAGETLSVLTNEHGALRAHGDEVISPFWRRADAGQPVRVIQLAAYHQQGQRASIGWYAKGASSGLNGIMTHNGSYGQTVLPHLEGGSGIAAASFTPSADAFGFGIDGVEFSDPNRNGVSGVCRQTGWLCGHDVRFWSVKDRNGNVIPNTYFMIMDYVGINYDYNDNIYLVSNIKPADMLINVGAPPSSSFVGPGGRVWMSDASNAYAGSDKRNENIIAKPQAAGTTAPNEPVFGSYPYAGTIAFTDNQELYKTYRAKMNPDPALPERVMNYRVPINNGTYTVKLHFAELYWTQPGQRVFDVRIEGATVKSNFDIIQQARAEHPNTSGKDTAVVLQFPNVQVTDGVLNISTVTKVDYGALSGIEILR